MRLKTILVICTLSFHAMITQAGVVTSIDYNANILGGDESPATSSYSETDGTLGLIDANETVTVVDNNNSIRGRSTANGIATSDGSTASFAQQTLSLGAHRSGTNTVVTQLITNDGPSAATGTLRSEILAGALLHQTATNLQVSDFNGSANFGVNIALDGISLFDFSGSLNTDGTILTNNMGFLNGLGQTNFADNMSLFWDATQIDLDLGLFSVAESKTLEFTLTTFTEDTTGCTEIAATQCMLSVAALGDPPTLGFGYAMFASTYFPPTEVPEPTPLALMLIGLLGLGARRARAK